MRSRDGNREGERHRPGTRRRPSHSTVAAYLALFLALGGGSFAVAALSSGDKQVVKKIAKKEANKRITQRAPGLSVNNADKLDGVDSTGFVRGRKLDLNLNRGDPVTEIATVGPYEISGECTDNGTATILIIYATGPAGNAQTIYDRVRNDTTDLGSRSRADLLTAAVATQVFNDITQAGQGYTRFRGTTVLRSSTGVIVQVDFSALAWDSAAVCHVWGTATMAR